MPIGQIIRKRRKELGMTQEEMADFLGVSIPAVSKWENGSALPDITLLSPIARLLEISLDRLLSFRPELDSEQIIRITVQTEEKLKTEKYDEVFSWAQRQVYTWPGCRQLVYNICVMLEGRRMAKDIKLNDDQQAFIYKSYEKLLKSDDEAIRIGAAQQLYNFFINKKDYENAQKYLDYFSIENPERKRRQARIYRGQGKSEMAMRTLEELLLQMCMVCENVFNDLNIISLEQNDMEMAFYYSQKQSDLEKLFDRGDYCRRSAFLQVATAAKDVSKTLDCAEKLLSSAGTLSDFTKSALYRHMNFKPVPDNYESMIRETLLECFNGEEYSYMLSDSRWTSLLEKYKRIK